MAKRRVRVRSKRLDELDESKLALALWLLARGIVADKTNASPSTKTKVSSKKDEGPSSGKAA
jgi:hypothetical protein